MKYPSVLVACPQSDVKAYCFDDWLMNVIRFTYPNFAVYMADNSSKNNFSRKIRQLGIGCDWVKPFGKSLMQRMAESHELCRKVALEKGFQYLLHLESDVFPPVNIIEQLLAARKSVVGAVYHIGQGYASEPMVQLVEPTDDDNFIATRYLRESGPEFFDGTIKKVFHAGLGCLLIHRSVLPHFQFRYEKGRNFHPDSFFAMDLYRKGIEVHVDTGILCQHRNTTHSVAEILN